MEAELSEHMTLGYVPLPANEMFAVKLKTGGSLVVSRHDQLIMMSVPGAEDIKGDIFSVSPEPIPGKREHVVKMTKLAMMRPNGVCDIIEGTAGFRQTCHDASKWSV